MPSWVFATHLKAVLLLDSGAGRLAMWSVKAEFQVALSEYSPCCHWCRFKLVNGGSGTQAARVFWQPFSSSTFCFGQIPLFFPHFWSRLSPSPYIVSMRISLCLCLLHCRSVCLFLPLPSFRPPFLFFLPAALFILGFSSFSSLDDKSVMTMSKLRSNTEHRRHWCLPRPENAWILWSPFLVSTEGDVFTLPLCAVLPDEVRLFLSFSPGSSVPASSTPGPRSSPALGSSHLLMSQKKEPVGILVRGSSRWACFSSFWKDQSCWGQDSRISMR